MSDFDLDDLFRDEFKPSFTHALDSIKEEKAAHKALVDNPLAVDSSEMPRTDNVDISVSDVSREEAEEESRLFEEASKEFNETRGDIYVHEIDKHPVEIAVTELEDTIAEVESNTRNYPNYSHIVDADLAELRRRLTGEVSVTQEDIYVETEEEEIQEEIDEVLSGEVVAYPLHKEQLVIEDDKDVAILAIEGEVMPDMPVGPSALEVAVAELERVRAMDMEDEAQKNAIRAKINETQKILDELRREFVSADEKHRNRRAAIREAEALVSEESHIEAERLREEDIKKQRKTAMMQFHHHIEELNPEWKAYAFDHQWEGASTLALHESGLLADEMGLGKTLSAIMYLDMVKAKRVLVITPNDTNSNFTLELAMWAKHRFVWSLAGADKAGRSTFMEYIIEPRAKEDKDICLAINYEQLYTDEDYFQRLLDLEFDTIIIDEAHSFKNKSGILFGQLKRLRNKAKRVLPMTGTFILNSPLDIWPALHLVDNAAFPTEGQFKDHYCEWDYYTNKWVFRSGGEKSMLIRLGGRIVKRNMAEAGIVLPTQHFHEIDIEFPQYGYEDQKNIMRQLADHSQIILDSDRKISIVEQIALITRQRQCAVWPAGITIKDPVTEEVLFSVGEDVQESIKMDWVESKLKELRNGGKRIAVFSQFKTALAELERRLIEDGFRVVRYDGDTDKETKAKVKRDFDRRHVEITGEWEWDIVLCNFKTGGVGLNFTHATDMIMLDENWNPGTNQQAYARINRIGQDKETDVWIPRLTGSIDGWMKALNDMKRDIIAGFDSEVDLQKEFSEFLATVRSTV
jgi:SNF2 family DNA or RNA helicase